MKLWIALLVMWPLVARAAEPCSNSHFMHAIDPALTPTTCAELPAVTYARGKTAKVLHTGTASREETTAVNDIGELLSKAAGAASSVRMEMPEKITVFLDPRELAPENRASQLAELAAAERAGAAEAHECVLAYHYKSTDVARKFAVVHQLFHCIIANEWPESRMALAEANWWAEGSAEFFASIAYPGVATDGNALTFHANESAPLFSHGKDAVVFFDWYCTNPGALKGLLEAVQDKSQGEYLDDLNEMAGGNHWLQFEEAYFDHTIVAPGGHPVTYPNTPAPPTTRINSSTTKTFTATPYVIRGATLEFAEGHAYDLDGGENNDFHWKWTEQTGGGWADPPTTVHTCHQTKKYRLVFAAKNREVTKRLRVTARDEREADCPCVVGTWQQTSASLARVATRMQQRGIRNASCSVDGGGTSLAFTADHSGGETYQGMHTTCTGPSSTSEGTSNGTRSFTWAETSPTQITFSSAGGNASSHIVVRVHGHSSEMNAPLTGAGSGAVTYRCTRTDLHLDYGTEAFDYTRTR